MISRDRCRKISERILSMSKADEVSVSISSADSTHVRFADNAPTTSGANRVPSVTVESRYGRRSGTATVNQIDDRALAEVISRSQEIARLVPEDLEQMPLLAPQSYAARDSETPPSTEALHSHLVEGVAGCIDSSKTADLVSAGFATATTASSCLATSTGLFAYHADTSLSIEQTARTRDGSASGWASSAGRRPGEVDFRGAAEIAIAKARAGTNPRTLEPGHQPAILEPACVATMVELLLSAMDARATDEGRSYFSKVKLGAPLFSGKIDIESAPGDQRIPSRPWGEDGLPHEPRKWIDRGTLANLSRSRFWAHKTGNAAIPGPPNALMAGDSGSLDQLIATTKQAILVTSLWYVREVDPQSLLYTGLTRDGTFLVEDGKIVAAVHNFRWNDSPIAVFKSAAASSAPVVTALRTSRRARHVVPGLRVESFGFSTPSDAV